jgi:hypothetical protein
MNIAEGVVNAEIDIEVKVEVGTGIEMEAEVGLEVETKEGTHQIHLQEVLNGCHAQYSSLRYL